MPVFLEYITCAYVSTNSRVRLYVLSCRESCRCIKTKKKKRITYLITRKQGDEDLAACSSSRQQLNLR